MSVQDGIGKQASPPTGDAIGREVGDEAGEQVPPRPSVPPRWRKAGEIAVLALKVLAAIATFVAAVRGCDLT